jgi:predicted metal-dependent HD superfamily phosphohydrolase
MNAAVNNTVLSYDDVHQLALQFFREHSDARIVYHDLTHTQQVAAAAAQIANHYQLNDNDFFIVLTAAWFHDVGYFIDMEQHEEKGAEQIANYLRDKQVDETTINSVTNCILATKLPQRPNNLLEKIVCDADLFHFGTDEFSERNKLMRKEYIAVSGKEISKEDWRKKTIQLLESHHYFTDYCQLLLNGKKQENIEQLKKKAEKEEAKQNDQTILSPDTETGGAIAGITGKEQKKKDKVLKEERPDKGVETMFRISSGNHQKLSDQADSKSHILITVNSIIISVVLSVLFKAFGQYPYLQLPAYLLLAVSLATIILSILATRPNIPSGVFTQKDIDEKKVNLLFFGNFYKMGLNEFAGGMLKMMEDREFLYGSLIRDVYSQGIVLGRKYKILRVAYNVFMYGLIISVVAFVVATLVE